MSSTYHTTEGIVLKKTPYGEADFLARILTKDFGKIDLRMRGARKHNSKLNPHLDLLDYVGMSFVKNGDRIPTVIDSQKISNFGNLSRNSNNFTEAAKIIRAIDLLMPLEVKDHKFFFVVKDFLESFPKISSENFLRNIISHEGYGKALSLPESVQEFIINTWPLLKS